MPTITSTASELPIERITLDNGITLLCLENQTVDLIAGQLFFKQAGAGWDDIEKAGLSNLVAATITKGTETLSSAEIAERVESVGAYLGASAAADYFVMSLKTVKSDFSSVLSLLGEIMRSPAFLPQEVELEKHLAIQSIRSQQEQPFNIAFNQLRTMMYPDRPYGFSVLGTENTVSGIARADLQQYHQTHFRPDNLIISLAGRIAKTEAIALVEKVFGDWQIPPHSLSAPSFPPLIPNPTKKASVRDTQQAIVMFGYLGASVKSRDYAALKLISTYLGNGLSSRLFVELREKQGLAYDVSAFYPTRLEAAPFITYIGTAPANTEIAMTGLQKEVERLCNSKLTEAEIDGAKNKLLGQYALSKQTNGEIAQIYGWYESLGLGIEFDRQFQADVARVTPEIVQTVANKYLDRPYLSLVGPNLN